MMTPETLYKTPLNEAHKRLEAKLVPFGGWEMPLQFGKVLEEHHAVRQAAGLFDICHMGILGIASDDVEFTKQSLNLLIPQNLDTVVPGKAVYTQLLNEQGGIIDDIIVYWVPANEHFTALSQFMIICNASNTPTVLEHIKRHLPEKIALTHLNDTYGLLALQGPAFKAILEKAQLQPSGEEALPKRFRIGEYQLFGNIPALVSRTGYTGEDGVELLVSIDQVEQVWEQLLTIGKQDGLRPIGLAARDTLRLEAAYPLHGSELTPEITPLEAGLGWSVKLDQPYDFMGKDVFLKQKQEGLKKHFVCFQLEARAIPRHDQKLQYNGAECGLVTSGSISPTLGIPIGVGYIHAECAPAVGDTLQVNIRDKWVDATIVKRPFYTPPAS